MKIWTKNTRGLRQNRQSGIWYINATVNGDTISKTTKETDFAKAYDFAQRYLAGVKAPAAEAITLANAKTLAPFVARYSAEIEKEFRLGRLNELTKTRKTWEAGCVLSRWTEFRVGQGTPRALAEEKIALLSREDLENFQVSLVTPRPDAGFLGYTPVVANRLVVVVTSFLDLVEEHQPGYTSPARHGFRKIEVERPTAPPLPTREQFAAVLAALRSDKWNPGREDSADLAEGLAYSNIRIDEARRLRVEHVILNIVDPKTGVVGGCLDLPKEIVKGKKYGRVIPLVGESLALFTKLVKQAGPDGKIFKASSIRRPLKRACEAVGCTHLTHHKLRHWWGTFALEATQGDVKQVAEWLGHRDGGKLVLSTYTHTRPERTLELAKRLTFDWGTPKVPAA